MMAGERPSRRELWIAYILLENHEPMKTTRNKCQHAAQCYLPISSSHPLLSLPGLLARPAFTPSA